MTKIDDLIDRLRTKAGRTREALDFLPPDVRAGVDQNVCADEDAIRVIECLRAALEEMTAHIEKDIENFDDELSSKGQEMVERARKALKGSA